MSYRDLHRQSVEPADRQAERFITAVVSNHVNATLLERLPKLGLRDWYLVAGCLFQSVWNGVTRRPATYGISDYDLFYCDPSDTSWEAEDQVIRTCSGIFADLDVEIQVRNQARVHLWYPQKFGVECQPLLSSRDAVDTFLNQSSCVAIRSDQTGAFDIYAPFGFDDLFSLIIRPNPRRNLPAVYYQKAARWCECWPELTVLPWPEDIQPSNDTEMKP